MSRFDKENFIRIISLLNVQEEKDEDIFISVGILEFMYDDDAGYIDEYFHLPHHYRVPEKVTVSQTLSAEKDLIEELWNKIQN